MNEVVGRNLDNSVQILPALPQTLQWAQIIIIWLPVIYMSFHGWFNSKLIDTTKADRLAVTFFFLTTIAVLSISFSYFSFENRVKSGELVCEKAQE